MKAFECKMCGECCYGKGGITISEREIEMIANFLNISHENFLRQYCEILNGMQVIKAGDNGFCIFFDPASFCLIHEVKPDICRLWPFYKANMNDEYNWNMAKEACPGINRDSAFMDFVKQGKR